MNEELEKIKEVLDLCARLKELIETQDEFISMLQAEIDRLEAEQRGSA